jgi:short-subunit dehydrogenase
MDKYSLAGRNIGLIGANSDIAKALLRRLQKESCHMFLFSRNTAQLQDFCAKEGIAATIGHIDLEDVRAIENLARGALLPMDGLIIAAGFLPGPALAGADAKTAEKTIKANYAGIVCLLELLKDNLRGKEGAFISVISSLAAVRGKASNALYASAKAGLTAYLEGLAQELYGRVRVCAIQPGYVATKMLKGRTLEKFCFTQTPDAVAGVMLDIIKRGKTGVFYTSVFWRLAAFCLRLIPGFIYYKLKL